jgi:iron complex outermembrane receptor protein
MKTRVSVSTAVAIAMAAATTSGMKDARAADEPVASAAGTIEEVTVTARRREEKLQDVPISVSAFSGEQLDRIGASDITALQQSTPNLTLQPARGTNSTLIAFIRGVGQQDPLWGFEPGVGLYIDDVYVARPQGAVLDIYNIDRVEVLRGPQGTLYGRNTIGGAVKYVTARLDDKEPTFKARVNLGNYAQTDLIVSGSTPVSSTLAIGATLAAYRHAGYGENRFTGHQEYNKNENAFRATAEWTPAESVFFRLAGDYLDDKSNARHGHREVPGAGLTAGEQVLSDVYDTRAGAGDTNHVQTRGASILGQWELNDLLTFKSITAYRNGATETLIDFDTSPAPALDIPARYADDQFTQELQLLYQAQHVQAVAGLYYLDSDASGAFDTVVGIANLTIATSGKVKTKSYAGFADVSFDIADHWSASVGGRYTKDDKTGTVYRQNFTGLRSPLFGNAAAIAGLLRTNYTNSRSFSEFTPRVSLTYKPVSELSLYSSYGRGFKSGGFDMRGDAFAYPSTANGYNPEVVDTYELGAKGSLLDRHVTFAADVFYSKYKDQQVTSQFALPTAPPTIISFVDNVASSDIKGAELESTIGFTKAFSTTLEVGYTDAQYKEFVTYDPATGTRHDVAGQRQFQYTSKYTGSVAFTYRQDLGSNGNLTLVPALSYRSRYQIYETPVPALDQKAFTLVDAGLTWQSANDHYEVGLYGRNLGDVRYRVGGYNFPGAVYGNSVTAYYGPPRTYTLSATWRP